MVGSQEEEISGWKKGLKRMAWDRWNRAGARIVSR
jgi:hypothetical protein